MQQDYLARSLRSDSPIVAAFHVAVLPRPRTRVQPQTSVSSTPG